MKGFASWLPAISASRCKSSLVFLFVCLTDNCKFGRPTMKGKGSYDGSLLDNNNKKKKKVKRKPFFSFYKVDGPARPWGSLVISICVLYECMQAARHASSSLLLPCVLFQQISSLPRA